MYTNDDDDIINNPPNDASLLNIEDSNNFKEIDNKQIITPYYYKTDLRLSSCHRWMQMIMKMTSVYTKMIFFMQTFTLNHRCQLFHLTGKRQINIPNVTLWIIAQKLQFLETRISKDGRKICILSDSICNRIKIHEFNKYIKNKKTYKLCFPGGDTKSIHHYALHALKKDKPDIVIINVGSNNMKIDKPITIAEDLISLTEVCKTHGVR